MSATTLLHRSGGVVSAERGLRRPAVDIMVEKVARRLLAWSEGREQRAFTTRLTHERVALIRENERLRIWAGSSFGH